MFFMGQSSWQNSGDYARYFFQEASEAILRTGRWQSLLPLWIAPLPIWSSPRSCASCICLSIHQLIPSGETAALELPKQALLRLWPPRREGGQIPQCYESNYSLWAWPWPHKPPKRGKNTKRTSEEFLSAWIWAQTMERRLWKVCYLS